MSGAAKQTISEELAELSSDYSGLKKKAFKQERSIVDMQNMFGQSPAGDSEVEVGATIDNFIKGLFDSRWVGESVLKSVGAMKAQLYKTMCQLRQGYWSGHTAYNIAVDGGFVIDSKSGTHKKLTLLGKRFVEIYEKENGLVKKSI